jgi:hypothetical protein
MRYKKRIAALVMLCVISALISVPAMASDVESGFQPEAEITDSPADILASAGITPEEAAQVKSLQGIIAHLISSGQITAQQAQSIVRQHIYGIQPDSSGTTSNNEFLGLSVKSARVLPESVTINPESRAANKTHVAIVASSHNQLQMSEIIHMYYRIFGATARANATDSYEITFYTQREAAVPQPSVIIYLKGPDGLILDKTAGVTDSDGKVTVKVSAKQPGIYTLTASCDHTTGQKFASAEMEFVSKDVALPTPIRSGGEPLDLEPAESLRPVAPSAPVSGQIDRLRSHYEISVQSAAASNAYIANLTFHAYNKDYYPVTGTAYVTTSLGANFWQSGNAWILADGVRLTDLVGSGAGAAFAFPVSGSVALQFVSTSPVTFSVGIGVNESLAADGTLYKYACGAVSAEAAQAVEDRNNRVQILPAGTTAPTPTAVPPGYEETIVNGYNDPADTRTAPVNNNPAAARNVQPDDSGNGAASSLPNSTVGGSSIVDSSADTTPASVSAGSSEAEETWANPFTDVNDGDWFYGDVAYAHSNKLIAGTGENTFSPKTELTRAMLVTILAREAGAPTGGGENWYSAAVEWGVANGITDGANMTGDVTREQLAAILYRYAKLKGRDVSKAAALADYADAAEVSEWAADAISWANATGILTGRTATELAPGGITTRAEAAAFLRRFKELGGER